MYPIFQELKIAFPKLAIQFPYFELLEFNLQCSHYHYHFYFIIRINFKRQLDRRLSTNFLGHSNEYVPMNLHIAGSYFDLVLDFPISFTM